MWKILRLHLVNFIHIYAGMNKKEIELDFTDCDKKINILIGKMGSGKSSVLGHLQPFATYGSLDVRNGDDLILPEEDGLKEITYLHDGRVYKIMHKYIWSKSTQSHNTRSFITVNGKELNENGNVSSFKDIIRDHFGLDQNFLRLLRLGPNVANVINMKSTERKAFIASLLKDTEVYNMLYKKLNEDLRNMNAALSVLSNKLVSLSSDKENELKREEYDLRGEISKLNDQVTQARTQIANLRGINSALSGDEKRSVEEVYRDLQHEIEEEEKRLGELNKVLESIPEDDVQKTYIRYGEITNRGNSIAEEIERLQNHLSKYTADANKLEEFILIHDSDDHIAALRNELEEVARMYQDYDKDLEDFHASYNYNFLESFLTQVETFQIQIDEICNNRKEVIQMCYDSDSSIKRYAERKLEILGAKQWNNQQLLKNIKFAEEYTCPIPLYRPPTCPTEDCPFIQSHPAILAMLSNDDKCNTRVKEIKDEIANTERDIAIFQECLYVGPQMHNLKEMWKKIYPVLDNLGVLNQINLRTILLKLDQRACWYNHERFIRYLERMKKYEQFESLQARYNQIKLELQTLEDLDVEEKKKELQEAKDLIEKTNQELINLGTERNEIDREKEVLLKSLEILEHRTNYQNEKTQLETILMTNRRRLQDLADKKDQVVANMQQIKLLEDRETVLSMKHMEKSKRFAAVQSTLQDIKSTKESYEEYLQERDYLKYIMDAVGSKEGIPLLMVKSFLDQSREIINNLISDIFEDDLEIIDFDVSETSNEFRIPYRINGEEVRDIELASQGQMSVISIALSFAFCQKSMFDYNIMLLDEIDNSIYKADREKFIAILSKQMMAMNCDQVFLITHNDIFQQSGLPVNIIMTTPEIIDPYPNQSIMQI